MDTVRIGLALLLALAGCAADAGGGDGTEEGSAGAVAPAAPQCPSADDCTICEAETDDGVFVYWTDTVDARAHVTCHAIFDPPGLRGTAEYNVYGGENSGRPCTAGVYSFELLGAGGFARVQNGSTGEIVMLSCTKQR